MTWIFWTIISWWFKIKPSRLLYFGGIFQNENEMIELNWAKHTSIILLMTWIVWIIMSWWFKIKPSRMFFFFGGILQNENEMKWLNWAKHTPIVEIELDEIRKTNLSFVHTAKHKHATSVDYRGMAIPWLPEHKNNNWHKNIYIFFFFLWTFFFFEVVDKPWVRSSVSFLAFRNRAKRKGQRSRCNAGMRKYDSMNSSIILLNHINFPSWIFCQNLIDVFKSMSENRFSIVVM